MSDEEKKIINELYMKAITSPIEAENYPNMICMKKDMLVVLNLIGKKQTELEENYISKDKIRDKIEEYNKMYDETKDIKVKQSIWWRIKGLKELLESEE